MRYSIYYLMLLLCLCVVPAQAQTIEQGALRMHHEKAATMAFKSLNDLAQLAKQVDVRTLGFNNLDQVLAAKLGQPIADVMVRLDELREYRPGDQVKSLLHVTGRLIYPLEVDRMARSAMVLSLNKSENWTLESFGGASQIGMLTELRKQLANQEGRSQQDYYQVRVPALQLMFLGIEQNGEEYLSPLFDMPVHGMAKGKIYPASEVLEKLVDAARKHNGEPT